MNANQHMPDNMPFGLKGFPKVERIDGVRNIVYLTCGDSVPIVHYMAGGEECGNPLRADTLVAGPYQDKWLVLPIPDGAL
ncbi:hypothetical protein D869_gp055 [Caulobacter phage CcrRogue]|uniref:Uncharacterized protein n=1 Tax=Caulobacter phage CcrRogue TaxID=2927986 RepID=K4K2W7_9CAUD|nr:hypothetical protein D869_gp055 [Caulobacter phage CcrRogue]AFU86537.1 hypothetical protein CcrRogue_gp055 [Caulobacter phage CcrRogue]